MKFIAHEPPLSAVMLAPLLQWMFEDPHRPLTLDDIACQASMLPARSAVFPGRQADTTPLRWVLAVRARRAQALLEVTALPIDQVAARVGFEFAMTLRDRFSKSLGVSPTGHRRVMGGVAAQPDRKDCPAGAAV